MIEVRNLQIHNNIPFAEYLNIPGYSFSKLQSDGNWKAASLKMRFGSAVDCYLFTPDKFKMSDYPEFTIKQIKTCANCVRNKLGTLWKHLGFQLSITAEFVYQGFVLQYKGRPDCAIKDLVVVDLKLTEGMNPRFNYKAQLSGYSIALGAPISFIAAQHPKKEVCDIHYIDIEHTYWEQACLLKGEVAA